LATGLLSAVLLVAAPYLGDVWRFDYRWERWIGGAKDPAYSRDLFETLASDAPGSRTA